MLQHTLSFLLQMKVYTKVVKINLVIGPDSRAQEPWSENHLGVTAKQRVEIGRTLLMGGDTVHQLFHEELGENGINIICMNLRRS